MSTKENDELTEALEVWLEGLRKEITKLTPMWYEEKIAYYKLKVKEYETI